MDIALLNVTIRIQKCEVVADAAGNHVNGWTDYYTCHATVGGEDSAKAAESEETGMTVDHPGISFTVRYCRAAAGRGRSRISRRRRRKGSGSWRRNWKGGWADDA